MDLKTKISRSTILRETQKVLLLAKLDKIPQGQLHYLEALLDQDEKVQQEGLLAMKTWEKKTSKHIAEEAEDHA